jgi:hypothetical protein
VLNKWYNFEVIGAAVYGCRSKIFEGSNFSSHYVRTIAVIFQQREFMNSETTKYECGNGKEQISCPERSLNSIQLTETNGFRAAARFLVLNEIITTICKLTALLLFFVLSDLCDVRDSLCVMVHGLLYRLSWVVFAVGVFAAE